MGTYIRLVDIKNAQDKEVAFLEAVNNEKHELRFNDVEQSNFEKIPGSPLAYWVSNNIIKSFVNSNVKDIATCKSGIMTGNDKKFVKFWFEPSVENISFNCKNNTYLNSTEKWYPINTGGFRKWYGNLEQVVNIQNQGYDIKHEEGTNFRLRDSQYYFREGVVWSEICTGTFSSRYCRNNTLFFVTAPIAITNSRVDCLFLLSLLNSSISNYIFNIINPTLHYNIGCIEMLPYVCVDMELIIDLTDQNISISKTDWDSFETSWDFVRHPLIEYNIPVADIYDTEERKLLTRERREIANLSSSHRIFKNNEGYSATRIKTAYMEWEKFVQQQFAQLKQNEEQLNRIFIEIYGLQDELTPEVEDKDITIRKADLVRDIKSLISYAVGCMFGRYSLDYDGLAFAGGDFDSTKYNTFVPDETNILPINDNDYFDNDIVSRFIEFIKTVYGQSTLEENLAFIANALYPNANGTDRERIRRYFLNDFYKDHVKIYQKKPIYWLFDSGKQNGFKCLIYLHRYNKYTVARIRTDYLHTLQRKYESEIKQLQMHSDMTEKPKDKADYRKQIDKIEKQLAETHAYEPALAHIANKTIELDLDDGVTVNYSKFMGVDGVANKKVDLLAKI